MSTLLAVLFLLGVVLVLFAAISVLYLISEVAGPVTDRYLSWLDSIVDKIRGLP